MKKEFEVNWYKILLTDEQVYKNKIIDNLGFVYWDLIKASVDIERNIIAIWWELHVDEEEILLENGSKQNNIWWINLYLNESKDKWIEFDSMINIRPKDNNFSRWVEDKFIQEKIKNLVYWLIKDE